MVWKINQNSLVISCTGTPVSNRFGIQTSAYFMLQLLEKLFQLTEVGIVLLKHIYRKIEYLITLSYYYQQ
jgi:hypothetical protein